MVTNLKETRDKIKEISLRKGFTSFWECFDYMLLANYDEIDAIMVSLDIFDGKIWDNVITTIKLHDKNNEVYTSYNTTLNTLYGSIIVEIFMMTPEAKPIYKPLYKVYIETRTEVQQQNLEAHIKSVVINLKTSLAINLFNDGHKNF